MSDPGTITTAVPAQCLGPTYSVNSQDQEDGVLFDEYPDFKITPIECCAKCYKTPNCVASFFDTEFQQCQRLYRRTKAMGGKTDACPKGTEDVDFGDVGSGSVFAGPCGF